MQLDPLTAQSVRGMITWCADDARVARHAGCTVAQVRAVRRGAPRPRQRPVPPEAAPEDHVACEEWIRDLRRGSAELASAIRRAQDAPGG